MVCRHSASVSQEKWATPLREACVAAPPSSSAVTCSWVTVFTTPGPVTNMQPVFLTIRVKSVMAGE